MAFFDPCSPEFNYLSLTGIFLKVKSSMTYKMYLFQEVWKTRTWFSEPWVHTVMIRWVPTGHEFLSITVWMSGWENQFRFPNFLEEAFSDITVISQQISPFFPNKENKSPGGILWLKITDFLSMCGLLL